MTPAEAQLPAPGSVPSLARVMTVGNQLQAYLRLHAQQEGADKALLSQLSDELDDVLRRAAGEIGRR